MKEVLGAPFEALKAGADVTLNPPLEAVKRAANSQEAGMIWVGICGLLYRLTGNSQVVVLATYAKEGFKDGLSS